MGPILRDAESTLRRNQPFPKDLRPKFVRRLIAISHSFIRGYGNIGEKPTRNAGRATPNLQYELLR
jgi:hypothetical protein